MTTFLSSKHGRILMTADTVGGVWTYALELTRALGEHGVQVALATMGAPLTIEQRAEAEHISNLDVFQSNYMLEWMEKPWRDVNEAGEWLLQLERRIRPDIVHLNGYVHGALPWSVPTLVVGHSCVLSWWRAVKGEPAPAAWDQYQSKVARGLRLANLVVAPTQAMLSALDQLYGPLPSRMMIPNGREPSLFLPSVKEEFVLTAGRLWDEAKNVRALRQIAPSLSWPVYVAGEEEHPGGHSMQSEKTGNFHPLGRLSTATLASWYARAAIYALPARYEPFGLSALEAALAGCVLVLGDIPSLREVWGDAAVFVPPDDSAALKSSLEELITDKAHRKELARRARTRALEFSPQRMAQGYLAAYAELIEKAQRAEGAKEIAACTS